MVLPAGRSIGAEPTTSDRWLAGGRQTRSTNLSILRIDSEVAAHHFCSRRSPTPAIGSSTDVSSVNAVRNDITS
jgi:hypothetical protein